MATIRAAWKRTVQIKPYENETLELAVEQTDILSTVTATRLTEAAQDLNRMLAAAGDALILERLQQRTPEPETEPKGVDFAAARQRVRKPEGREALPSPKVIEIVKAEAPTADTVEPDGGDDYLNAS